MTRPKPGGYADRAALASARRAVQQIGGDIEKLIEDGGRMSPQRWAQVLSRVAIKLTMLNDALDVMDNVRRR